jgi:hypothetical protein
MRQPALEQAPAAAAAFTALRHLHSSSWVLVVAVVVARTTMWVTVPQELSVEMPAGLSMSSPMRLRFREASPAMAGMAVTP